MQVSILNGIQTDQNADVRTAYPINMIPVPKSHGIANDYLRPAYGIVKAGEGPGKDRGGINYGGNCYRVMGNSLVRIDKDWSVTVLATFDGSDVRPVRFDYSFDRLAFCSDGALYYWKNDELTKVEDNDLGQVNDFVWVDGYFLCTDGNSMVVTELTDPTSVNPLKYGSSEADPDPILSLLKLRGEIYAVNRNTIEVFQNVGGALFPFQRVAGGQILRGSIGTRTCCVFLENIAFLGGGRNEAPAIWLGVNGASQKISTREIDQLLLSYSDGELALSQMEVRVVDGHQFLYLHLPDRTIVYDGISSAVLQRDIWHILSSGISFPSRYRAKNYVWCHDQWICGDTDTNSFGYLTPNISTHWGNTIAWEFNTPIFYNAGAGAIFHEVELVCLTGRVSLAKNPIIWTSYSLDGLTWSLEKSRVAGRLGERNKRISWLQQGYMRHWRIQKFRGTSDAHMTCLCLELKLEPMSV